MKKVFEFFKKVKEKIKNLEPEENIFAIRFSEVKNINACYFNVK